MLKQSGLQMTNSLRTIITKQTQADFATKPGAQTHKFLQKISSIEDLKKADSALLKSIISNQNIARFFEKGSKTEVPIAGTINGKFISRRIDRLLINHKTKTIDILDYKTDVDKSANTEKYYRQIDEYKKLLQDIYPNYKINGYILWLHNLELEAV